MNTKANTLLDTMRLHVRNDESRSILHLWDGPSRSYFPLSYAELSRRAFAFGARLLEQERRSGDVCMIACHSPYATLLAYYGAVSVGLIPMIFPMPKALGSHDALIERIQHWGALFKNPPVLILEEGLSEKFHEMIPPELEIIRVADSPDGTWDTLDAPAGSFEPAGDDIAFFQTTSSSTGDHKAVAITHRNILANVRGIKAAVGMDDNESMVGWLPLFHDMGLVGSVLFCFCNRFPLYLMTPVQFVKRPLLWMKGMSEHGCTIATAPNFGYDYCARLISDRDAGALDLGHVKHLFIGAEPIRVSTIEGFTRKFQAAGLEIGMMRPAYGLAESTIITSISTPEDGAKFLCLDTGSITINEPVEVLGEVAFEAASLEAYDGGAHVAACTAGRPIDGMHVEIVDEDGKAVGGEGIAGEVVLAGHSVAAGYVVGGDEVVKRFPGGRVMTGDMGVLIDGQIYIIERIKNLIIRNGENYLVSVLEERIADLLETSHDHIAVFESDIHDPASDIIVLVERHAGLREDEVNPLLVRLPQEGFPIDRMMFSKAREIPRTTSGKKRHFYCRKLYQSGELGSLPSIEISPERIMRAHQS
jgi:acyl-CoA synthetase (AMP-forming)/AMP-acid ligase II